MAMPVTHSDKNFTLGKGISYFGRFNPSGVNVEGELDLGNSSALTWNVDIESLMHYSQRSGLKKKDKDITVQVTPKFTVTLDEPTPEILAMMGLGEVQRVNQAASDTSTASFISKKNRFFAVPGKGIGVTVVQYKTGTAAFTLGAVLSGATGSGTIVGIEVTSGTPGTSDEAGYLYIQNVTPGFVLDEAIVDDNATPGAAVAAAVEVFDTTRVSLRDTATGLIEYIRGTDYSVDSKTGRVFIPNTSTIADATGVMVYYGLPTMEWSRINCYTNTKTEGVFRFVGDVPQGINCAFVALKTSVKPSGDVTLVGDDWQTVTLEVEVLADPYGNYLELDIDDITV